MMSWVQSHFKLRNNLSMYSFAQTDHRVSTPAPPPQSPPQPSPHGKASLTILVVCVSLTVVVFIYFLLYLLVRFLMTRRPPSPILPHSNRYPEEFSSSDAFQRQLQELFQLQDSGLDQASIDALPVFGYKDIMGSKERYDCAVCLNEFDEQDQLRLLPVCSHAFHVECIDSWLLSNSTCPLCRGSLQKNGVLVEKPALLVRDDPRGGDDIVGHKPGEVVVPVEKRVLPVRVGKFRRPGNGVEGGNAEVGETSRSSKLDARRCYSMGSYQYVVEPSDMQVTLCPGRDSSLKAKDGQNSRRIDIRSKSESLSVSKIWLWSKKGKFTSSFRTEVEGTTDNSSMLDSDLGRLHPQYISALVQIF